MSRRAIKSLLASVILMQASNILALEDFPIAYLVVAQQYQVPVDILYAVAMTESGNGYDSSQLPWPWALNVDGRSIYCQSRQEAVWVVSHAIQAKQSVDIGLMQISWRWHQHRFASIDDALIPMKNLKAGAAILQEQFEVTNDWWEAVGRYHDPGQDQNSLDNAEVYRARVRQQWQNMF